MLQTQHIKQEEAIRLAGIRQKNQAAIKELLQKQPNGRAIPLKH